MNAKAEASARAGFSGSRIVRDMEKRTDDAMALARGNTQARWIGFAGGKVAVIAAPDGGVRTQFGFDMLMPLGPKVDVAVLLGHADGNPVCAVPLNAEADVLPEPFQAQDVRSLYAQGLASQEELAAIAQGSAMLSWHATHRFCGRCGGRNRMAQGGAKRICEACAAEHFPRTDPVVIMLTVRGDFCLLARGAHFPENMISCLAGFMEPGETIEEAVRRETLEEAGIRTGAVTYHASQPWPFPHSLMIGCYAEALTEEITLDASEIEAGRWFSRNEVKEMLVGNHPEGWRVPPRQAIATLLIADWAGS